MADEIYDVAIIGGGPAGSSAALYTARAGLKTLVLDKLIKAGALGITSKIANYPAISEALSGEELVLRMQKHAALYGAQYKKAKVVSVKLTGETKMVATADGEVSMARAVILATGAMGRGNKVPGEEELVGKGVSYCATCDAAFFKNQDVAVVGSNEEALEDAVLLSRFVKTLTIVTPKPKLEIAPHLVEELTGKELTRFRYGTKLVAVRGAGSVSSIVLNGDGKEEELAVKGVFIYTQGNKPIVDYLSGQVSASPEGYVAADRHMATQVPGVFACGDLLGNDVQQAVVAAAQGCIAALSADKYLRKRKSFVKDYK